MSALSRLPTFTASLNIETIVETHPVRDSVVVYRLTHTVNDIPPHLKSVVRPQVREGVSTPEAVRRYEQRESETIQNLSANLFAAPDAFLAKARQRGVMAAMDSKNYDQPTVLREDVFTAVTRDGFSEENLVRLDLGAHMLFKLDGTVLPVGVPCDYISGAFHNQAYDLAGLVALLKDDPRITFMKPERHTSEGQLIHKIPYYNAEDGKSESVAFYYGPTPSEAIELWAKMQSYGTAYPSTRWQEAMRDLDVLGLKKAGLCRTPNDEATA